MMADDFHARRDKWQRAVDAVSLLETGEIMNGDMDLADLLAGIRKQIWAAWRISCTLRNR